MPVLPSLPASTIQQIYLPSTAHLPIEEQGWVKMETNPINVEDWLSVESDGNMGKVGLNVLAERIKEWNFTEENSAELVPINPETIKRLGPENLAYLTSQIKTDPTSGLSTEEKKS